MFLEEVLEGGPGLDRLGVDGCCLLVGCGPTGFVGFFDGFGFFFVVAIIDI